ncbi:MAG TPA: winged helix-turn-helix domain-containing protein [Xanthomonadaceae bacterium]|nr:winged helix-turn-helix domain-containing protein [Xanthomonadaceae bacterium]
MLNQHRNLVVPESDTLRVGDCIVDVPRREVACGGESRRITVKAMQVLLVLVAHAHKVVSREALLEWVWADTLPTDDVLTQAVTQLRKAFADDRESPRYLETIAKGGYRLIAAVEWQPPPPVPRPAAPDTQIAPASAASASMASSAGIAPVRRTIGYRVGWTLLALAAVAAVGWYVAAPRQAAAPAAARTAAPVAAVPATMAAAPFQRITSAPGSEMWPSLSPDGAQVVYSAWTPEGDEGALMVQTTAPVPPRALTSPARGVLDTMPAWSPNGREILFERLGPGGRCGLYLIPASGGEPRHVSDCRRNELGQYSWHPDGRHLIGSKLGTGAGDDGALQVLDLASGTWTPLAYRKAAGDMDLAPVYSPDGKWIVFRRNVSLSDLWRVPAAGGAPERLTDLRTNFFGHAWAPDGRSLVLSRYQDAGLQLSRLDLADHSLRDLGVANAAAPAIAARAPSLAFVVGNTVAAMYRLDLSRPQAKPEPMFPSTGLDLMPSIAPDGRQLAWMSNRSGRLGLWWARLDQPDSLRLIDGLVPVPRYAAAWSADGGRMLVVGRDGTRLALYEVRPDSARVQRLPVPAGEPVQADYLPAPDRLLVVADRGAGRLGVTLYDRSRTPWQALAQLDDVAMARYDAGADRILFTRPATPGLWQADLELAGVRKVATGPEVGGGRRLGLLPGGPWLADSDSQARCALRWASLATPRGALPCRHAGGDGAMLSAISLDARRGQLYYALERDASADIGWMPLPAH